MSRRWAVATAGEAHLALVALVVRARDAGKITIVEPTDAAQAYWAVVHGYVSLELLDINFASDADETFESLIAALIRGTTTS
jgi:hypothetical protein